MDDLINGNQKSVEVEVGRLREAYGDKGADLKRQERFLRNTRSSEHAHGEESRAQSPPKVCASRDVQAQSDPDSVLVP